MKTKRDVGKFLDFDNGSFIVSRVTFDPTGGWREAPDKDHTPSVNIKLSDCGRTIINIHEFGDTEESALEKLDEMIAILQKTRDNVQEAWKEYNNFWSKQERRYF